MCSLYFENICFAYSFFSRPSGTKNCIPSFGPTLEGLVDLLLAEYNFQHKISTYVKPCIHKSFIYVRLNNTSTAPYAVGYHVSPLTELNRLKLFVSVYGF